MVRTPSMGRGKTRTTPTAMYYSYALGSVGLFEGLGAGRAPSGAESCTSPRRGVRARGGRRGRHPRSRGRRVPLKAHATPHRRRATRMHTLAYALRDRRGPDACPPRSAPPSRDPKQKTLNSFSLRITKGFETKNLPPPHPLTLNYITPSRRRALRVRLRNPILRKRNILSFSTQDCLTYHQSIYYEKIFFNL